MEADQSSTSVVGVHERFRQQQSRTLHVNYDGIAAVHEVVRLTTCVQHRPYPEYDLGYDPRHPPRAVCKQFPGPSREAIENPESFVMEHVYADYVTYENLPLSLFLIERGPPAEPYVDVHVPDLNNLAGQPVRSSTSRRPLRYFSFLPPYIPHEVKGLVLEFWFRLDSRLEPSDILDRMLPDRGAPSRAQSQPVLNNSLSMRRQRFRTLIHAQSYQPGRVDPCRNEIEDLSRLTGQQILLNTSCVIHEDRLWIPRLNPRCTQIVDYINTGLPPWYFLGLGPHALPSLRMQMSIALRHFLQRLAITRGLGRNQDSWKRLPDSDHPASWHDRGKPYCAGLGSGQANKRNAGTVQGTASSTADKPATSTQSAADKFLEKWKDEKGLMEIMAARKRTLRRNANARNTLAKRNMKKRSAPEEDETDNDDEDYEDEDDEYEATAKANKRLKATLEPAARTSQGNTAQQPLRLARIVDRTRVPSSPDPTRRMDVVDLTASPGVPLHLPKKQYDTLPPQHKKQYDTYPPGYHNTPEDIHAAIILASRMNTQPVSLPVGIARQLASVPPEKLMGHITSGKTGAHRQHQSVVSGGGARDMIAPLYVPAQDKLRRSAGARSRQGMRYLPSPVHFGPDFLRRHAQDRDSKKIRPANWDELDEEEKMLADRTYHPGWRKLGEIQERRKAMGLSHTDSIPLARAKQRAAANQNGGTVIPEPPRKHQRLSTAQIDETWRRARTGHIQEPSKRHTSVSAAPARDATKVSTTAKVPAPAPATIPTAESSRRKTMRSHEPYQPEQPFAPQMIPLAGVVQDPRTGADMVLVPVPNVDTIIAENPGLPRYQLLIETEEPQYEELYDDHVDTEHQRARSLTGDEANSDNSSTSSMINVHQSDTDTVMTNTRLAPRSDESIYTHQPSLRPQWLPSEGYQYPVPSYDPTNAGPGWQMSFEPLSNGPILPIPRLHRSRSVQW